MKQPGILLFYGIALLKIVSSTTVDCSNGGMAVTRIETFDIEISWNSTCFRNDTTYGIQITGDGDCTRNNYPCEENLCKINIAGMRCGINPIKPCLSFTFTITGEQNGNSFDISTTAAPHVTPDSWQLENSNISYFTLTARWGPLENPATAFVKCANRTKVDVSCIASNGTEITISNVKDVKPEDLGELDLQINECDDGHINITAIYMSDDVETESTGILVNRNYTAPTQISCFECSANNTDCYNDFEDLVSEKKFISCYWKDEEGNADERGGLFTSHKEGWSGKNYYCSSDLCNAASTNSVATTFIAVVSLFLQFLLQ